MYIRVIDKQNDLKKFDVFQNASIIDKLKPKKVFSLFHYSIKLHLFFQYHIRLNSKASI
jgi:hypothetical protein